MEGRPDEDDTPVVAGQERPGQAHAPRAGPNLWILLGMMALALALTIAVLLVTAIM